MELLWTSSPSNTRGPMPPLVTNAYVGPFVGADPSIAFLPLPFDIPYVAASCIPFVPEVDSHFSAL